MLDAVVPAPLKHVKESRHVAVDVHMWIFRSIADARLSGEIYHTVGPMRPKCIFDRAPVGKIRFDVRISWFRRDAREPRFFERHVVVGIHIVDADDLVAAIQQFQRDVRADKSGGSGDEYFHVEQSFLFA